MPSINTFSPTPTIGGGPVTSTVNLSELISRLSDPVYFDIIDKVFRVDVVYRHESGRQEKIVFHYRDNSELVGTVEWTATARSGRWNKYLVKTWDFDGVRALLGSGSLSGEYIDL